MSERKDQILELATELLQTRGFTGFSYNDLSQRLGITKATIHHHFPNKEELGKAITEKYKVDIKNILCAAIKRSDNPWDQLNSYLELTLNIMKTPDRICAAGSVQSEINVVPKSMRKTCCLLAEYEIKWISEVLKNGREKGVMNFPGKPENQAALIFSATQGAMQYGRAHGEQKSRAVIRQIKDILKPAK